MHGNIPANISKGSVEVHLNLIVRNCQKKSFHEEVFPGVLKLQKCL